MTPLDATPRSAPARPRSRCAVRRERPWLALIAVPLAEVAALLAGVYPLVVPLAALAWWWAPQDAPIAATAVAVQMGCVGTVWALWGIYALALYPGHRLVVGLCWAGAMALVAALSAAMRRRYGRGF